MRKGRRDAAGRPETGNKKQGEVMQITRFSRNNDHICQVIPKIIKNNNF
jgi:hypothetical protein